MVGLHQNHISRYERGESRLYAEAFGGSTDYVSEGTSDQAAKARFEDRDLLRQFQEVERLPDSDKALVKSFLDAFLFKRMVEGLNAPERR